MHRVRQHPPRDEGQTSPGDAIARADRDLTAILDRALEQAARKGGAQLACRAGCSECCMGPFPINSLDALRLKRGMHELAARDPRRAAAIRERAREAIALMREAFPGDPDSGLLDEDEEAQDLFFERHAGRPCPALDPATQACDLYAHRPVSCRTYGPPVRFGGKDLPPCRLCFQGSPPEVIESCRVEPDPDGVEQIILDRLQRRTGESRESLIPWAVATDDL